jgi:GNAT superfamily N-acetyltransferase
MARFRLVDKDKMFSIIPLLSILNPAIPEQILQERITEMIEHGYECLGVYENEELIGICGLWLLVKYYVGRHIEVDNVIIHPDHQGKKIGEQMMEWVFQYARSKDCVALELNCYSTNTGGNKFWHNQGFRILGFHYRKDL